MSVIGCRIVLYAFLAVVAWQDGCYGRIPVRLAECTLLIGLLLYSIEGPAGMAWYLWRFVVFASLFFLLHLLGMMGGGDWKIFGLVGALTGWHQGFCIIGLALLTAGIFSVSRMLCGWRLYSRLQLFFWYCRRCFSSRRLYQYPSAGDDSDRIRLGGFVLIGAVIDGVWRLVYYFWSIGG